jgi:hypothetical protein
MNQGKGIEDFIPPKSPDVGETTTIRELLDTGAFPGPKGTILRDANVAHEDLYKLSTLNGRTIEFGLGYKSGPSGERVLSVNNGGIRTIGFDADIYPLAHTHPTPNVFQTSPSTADLNIMQQKVSRLRIENPIAPIEPHYIIYSADEVPTAFSPLPFDYFK